MLDPGNEELRKSRERRRTLWPWPIRTLRWWGRFSTVLLAFAAVLGGYNFFFGSIMYPNVAFGCWSHDVPRLHWRFAISLGAVLLCGAAAILTFLRPWGIWLWIVGLPLFAICEWIGPPRKVSLMGGIPLLLGPHRPRPELFEVIGWGSAILVTVLSWLHLALFDDPALGDRCAHCGYDTKGLPDEQPRCPECGQMRSANVIDYSEFAGYGE